MQFSRGDQRDGVQESTESLMDEFMREKAALSKVRGGTPVRPPSHVYIPHVATQPGTGQQRGCRGFAQSPLARTPGGTRCHLPVDRAERTIDGLGHASDNSHARTGRPAAGTGLRSA
jgi:hypothetical protein